MYTDFSSFIRNKRTRIVSPVEICQKSWRNSEEGLFINHDTSCFHGLKETNPKVNVNLKRDCVRFGIWIPMYKSTRHHFPGNRNLNTHCHGNHTSDNFILKFYTM